MVPFVTISTSLGEALQGERYHLNSTKHARDVEGPMSLSFRGAFFEATGVC